MPKNNKPATLKNTEVNMTTINKILTTVALIFFINIQSIYAVTHTLLVSPNPRLHGIDKINHIHDEESATAPQFEVNYFQYNHQLINKKSSVSFTISSPEFVSYYIYLANNENTILHETSGFINHNAQRIDLNLENIIAGNYDLVVEVYNNEKVSTKKTFPLIFK